jgi:protein phosphatase
MAKTAPLDPHAAAGQPDQRARRHAMIGTANATGVERSHNEDALVVLSGNFAGQENLPDFGLYVIADGMGGHRSGEVASSLSVRTVARLLTEQTVLRLFDLEPREDLNPLQDLVRRALEEANQTVVSRVPGGGTTLTAAVVLGEQMTIGHVGDSRAYVIRNGETKVITRDHSLVERLRELGQLTEEEAASHPQRNVLYRAIGQGANLEVDVFTLPVPRGGYLLMCSDGLWGVVPDPEILRIVGDAHDPQEACDALVRAANAAGGPDNITAVLVHFPSE